MQVLGRLNTKEKDNSALTKEDSINLLKSLAQLYVYERNFDKAVDMYMLLKDSAIFGVIEKNNLFSLFKGRIVELMEINADLAIRLLIDNEDDLSPGVVVTQLNKQPKLQVFLFNCFKKYFLDGLFKSVINASRRC